MPRSGKKCFKSPIGDRRYSEDQVRTDPAEFSQQKMFNIPCKVERTGVSRNTLCFGDRDMCYYFFESWN